MADKQAVIDYIAFYQEHVRGLKQADKDNWRGHCPWEERHSDGADQHPSFYINVQTGQYYCQACGAKGNLLSFCRAKGLPSSGQQQQRTTGQQPEAIFAYKDEHGTLLYQVCRFPGKNFRQRRPNGNGGWTWQTKGIRRVPYRLPELLKADHDAWVWIPEGEKHCDRLYSLGLNATCNVGGAGKWTPELSEYLRGRKVCILPDNDQPGQQHGQDVARKLHGIAAEIRILLLSGLRPKEDVINWLDDGGTKDKLSELLKNAPIYKPTTEQKTTAPLKREPIIRTLKELGSLDLPEIKWIIPDLIPEGCMILAGKPKCKKSWFALTTGVAVATGGYVLGSIQVTKGTVLYLALEDTERRLKDRSNQVMCGQSLPDNFHYCCNDWGRLPEAGIRIESFLDEHKDTRLVMIDTLQKIREPSQKGKTQYEQDYEAISALKAIADKYGIGMMILHHVRKATAEDIFDTLSGTMGLSGAADTIAVLHPEPRSKMDGTLYIKGRDVDETEKALRFDASIGTWLLMGDADEYRRSNERQELIDFLRETGLPQSPKEIADALGKKSVNVKKLLRQMLKSGEISSEGRAKYIYKKQSIIEGEI